MSIEATMKKRLQTVAKERKLTSAEVWQNVILERFLLRVCQSKHRDHFILKGGVLLAKLVPIGRETRDLDFLVRNLNNDAETIREVFKEIIQIDLQDGFVFRNVHVEKIEHFHMQYPGTTIRVDATFGKNHFSIFIDLAFGDIVEEKEGNLPLMVPLIDSKLDLKCYPLEFIFAEKLETIVQRGAENSRMKDYHDLYTMIQEGVEKESAKKAVAAVFAHRGTELKLPLTYEEILQHYWRRYLPTVIKSDNLPQDIQEILDTLNKWLEYDL